MPNPSPDLPALLDAIRADPRRGFNWLALAAWLCGNGRHDEATAIRVFWPRFSHHVRAGHSVHMTLREVARHATWWGRRARQADHAARRRDAVQTRPAGRTAGRRSPDGETVLI